MTAVAAFGCRAWLSCSLGGCCCCCWKQKSSCGCRSLHVPQGKALQHYEPGGVQYVQMVQHRSEHVTANHASLLQDPCLDVLTACLRTTCWIVRGAPLAAHVCCLLSSSWLSLDTQSCLLICWFPEHHGDIHDAPALVVALQRTHHSLEFLETRRAAAAAAVGRLHIFYVLLSDGHPQASPACINHVVPGIGPSAQRTIWFDDHKELFTASALLPQSSSLCPANEAAGMYKLQRAQ